ncbi:C-C motif chemokine 15 [Oryctolagus cuniculus]|uniref:C-C motif chemokine 15 n=1 Tax=Oryctolagus cuniculus TaxID=9986 RepID=UPI000390451D
MKLSTAALSLLLLAAVLGTQAFVLHNTETRQLTRAMDRLINRRPIQGVNPIQSIMPLSSNVRPSDCCYGYTTRPLQCSVMEDFFETNSQCSMPAVIFITKCGKLICANPRNNEVEECMETLKTQGTRLGPRAAAGLLY